jgi:hypothetical protein
VGHTSKLSENLKKEKKKKKKNNAGTHPQTHGNSLANS